jgi:hypothetical protein
MDEVPRYNTVYPFVAHKMPIKVDCGVDALHKYVLMPWAVKIIFQSRMPRLLQWRTPSARCFLLLMMLESKESSRNSDSRRYFPNTDRGLQVMKCLPLPAVGIHKTSGSFLVKDQYNSFLRPAHETVTDTASDIYQMLYWYSWFSWWWARGCSKHVENWNEHIEKNCASSWSFTKIHNKMLHGQQNIKSGSLFVIRYVRGLDLFKCTFPFSSQTSCFKHSRSAKSVRKTPS